MAEHAPRYRYRGNVKPTAESKRPVRAYRNADKEQPNGAKTTSATIDIFDVIDSYGGYWGISAAEVDQALASLGEKVNTLYVRVNSPGGEATEGFAIANLLRAYAATVHVTNYGLAASAASYISIAGDTFSMAPGSLLMIHEAANSIWGQADDLRAEADVLDKFNETIATLYAMKGGTDTDWRALMHAETWFTPEDAVKAGLADKVGIESGPPPVNPDDQAEPLPDVDGDMPFDRAARAFDLTVFDHAPAAYAAYKPPAVLPEHPSTKGAVDMTDEELKALRENLGLPEDADVSAILAAAKEAAQTKPAEQPTEVTEEQALEALAKASGADVDKVKAALATAADDKGEKVTLSKVAFEEMQANASLGAEARKQQLIEARDKAVDEAIKAGKISRDRREAWVNAWDKDPEGVKADIDKLEARFPTTKPGGYSGSDGDEGPGAVFTDDEAGALAQLAGVSKEALTNG